jgi:hypothetical protein
MKIIEDTPKRIYLKIKNYEVIYNKADHKTNCTCMAEAWSTPCKHKLEALIYLIKTGKITDKKMIEWAEREGLL